MTANTCCAIRGASPGRRAREFAAGLGLAFVLAASWLDAGRASSPKHHDMDLVLSLKIPAFADATHEIVVAIERRNVGTQPRVLYVREACPGATLDAIADGHRAIKLDWLGSCDDN